MNFITNKDKPSDLADGKKPDNFLNKCLFFFTDFWDANTPTVLTKINWKKVAGSWNSTLNAKIQHLKIDSLSSPKTAFPKG